MNPLVTVLLVDDHALVRRGFRRLLEDDAARRQWSERSRRRAATFTWEACAKRTIGAYRAALQAGQG